MAGGSCFARLLQWIAEMALSLSGPATRFTGSVPAAVTVTAVLLGVYELVIGSVYLKESWRFYYGMSGLIQTAGCLAYITVLANTALIFGVLRKNNEYLQNILSGVLALYFLCAPLCLAVLIGLTYNTYWIFQIWEVPRILAYPLHMSLLYCLLATVRGEAGRSPDAAALPADGWLKNNLARAAHGPLAADGVLLKVHGGGPATFTPSSCVTAPTVHLEHPPPRPHGPAPASGPLSSSEA